MEQPSFAVLDYLTDAVFVLDLDYRVVFANRAMLAACGDGDKVIGQKCHDLCQHCPTPCGQLCLRPGQCVFDSVLASGKPASSVHPHLLADGTQREFEVTASPIRDLAGDLAHVLLVLHDVSECMTTKRTLARSAEIDASLAELSKSLIADLTMGQIAELVKAQALRFTASQHAFVGFVAAEGMLVMSSLTPQEWGGQPPHGGPIVFKEI